MKNGILEDLELLCLRDDTPYGEGEPLALFLPEVEAVADAIANSGEPVQDTRERVLTFVRTMYFLGVQRGAEAYRGHLVTQDGPEEAPLPDDLPFELLDGQTEVFYDDIRTAAPDTLERFYRLIGI